MEVKNNYQECITNVACSIRHYFDLDYKHNTIKEIDAILEEKNPKNVVLMLFDGMGSRIINDLLSEEDFFKKNMVKEITSVCPATTTAATTSITTGLNPVEHCYLGWNMFVEPINETVTLFKNTNKINEKINNEFLNIKGVFPTKYITEELMEKGINAVTLFSFFEGGSVKKYTDFEDMLNKIEEYSKKDGKTFIYAYDTEPDETMHITGSHSDKAKSIIKYRSDMIEEFSKRLNDTLLIIVADHGHVDVENVDLKDYPDIMECLERTTSLEPRCMSFKVKNEYKDKFISIFNSHFGNDYKIYTKKEVINDKLFGDGEEHPLFESALGDFIALSISNKCLIDHTEKFVSHHAGYIDDEIYIPLIIKYIEK